MEQQFEKQKLTLFYLQLVEIQTQRFLITYKDSNSQNQTKYWAILMN